MIQTLLWNWLYRKFLFQLTVSLIDDHVLPGVTIASTVSSKCLRNKCFSNYFSHLGTGWLTELVHKHHSFLLTLITKEQMLSAYPCSSGTLSSFPGSPCPVALLSALPPFQSVSFVLCLLCFLESFSQWAAVTQILLWTATYWGM